MSAARSAARSLPRTRSRRRSCGKARTRDDGDGRGNSPAVRSADQRRGVLVASVSRRQGAGGSPLPRRTQPAAADRSDTPPSRPNTHGSRQRRTIGAGRQERRPACARTPTSSGRRLDLHPIVASSDQQGVAVRAVNGLPVGRSTPFGMGRWQRGHKVIRTSCPSGSAAGSARSRLVLIKAPPANHRLLH
jgi:hypothetical protein